MINFTVVFQLKDSKLVKKTAMVPKHSGAVQEVLLKKFKPGCIVIFRWVNLCFTVMLLLGMFDAYW